MPRRSTTALVTLSLAFGSLLLVPATAQASAPTYRCQTATLHTILANKPVIGSPCTGPVGAQPPGSVLDESMNRLYSCYYLEGNATPTGMYVFGSICEEV
ncbi:hypothetical protein [Amycolatopsis magusensis]|uniref:hypothetical protein n=1 Tax=Amycolatopsis magusensis TaxID=882444 RepID=UPI0037BD4EDB